MKKFNLLAVSLVFMTVFAVSTFAQTGAGKIGWINTIAFEDDKAGITKMIAAYKALETEFKPRLNELQTLDTKMKTIADDLQKLANLPGGVADPKAAQAKQEEGLRLKREFDFKEQEYKAAIAKRGGEVIGPIQADVYKAIDTYAKQKGFSAVLDISVFSNEKVSGILAMDPTTDITKDFITYYNTRPATTASTATPK